MALEEYSFLKNECSEKVDKLTKNALEKKKKG